MKSTKKAAAPKARVAAKKVKPPVKPTAKQLTPELEFELLLSEKARILRQRAEEYKRTQAEYRAAESHLFSLEKIFGSHSVDEAIKEVFSEQKHK